MVHLYKLDDKKSSDEAINSTFTSKKVSHKRHYSIQYSNRNSIPMFHFSFNELEDFDNKKILENRKLDSYLTSDIKFLKRLKPEPLIVENFSKIIHTEDASSHFYSDYDDYLKSQTESFKEHIENIEKFHKFYKENQIDAPKIEVQLFQRYLFQYLEQDRNSISQSIRKKLNSLNRKLDSLGEELELDVSSLFNYLYILGSKKIEDSPIAIDTISNKIVIYYSEDSNKESRKVSIIPNAKDFTVSVLSRKKGFAKLRGIFSASFPDAYYKINFLLETLV